MRRRERAVAGVLAGAGLLISAASAAAARPIDRPSPNVAAFSPPNHALAPNPALAGGTRVLVVVTGFAGNATVSVRVRPGTMSRQVHADRHGVVHLAYTVGTGDGPATVRRPHLMAFQGLSPAGAARSPRRSGSGNVVATVPAVGLFPFHPGGPGSGGGHGVEGQSASQEPLGLAETGVDVRAFLGLGLAALVVGAGAVIAGRRRAG